MTNEEKADLLLRLCGQDDLAVHARHKLGYLLQLVRPGRTADLLLAVLPVLAGPPLSRSDLRAAILPVAGPLLDQYCFDHGDHVRWPEAHPCGRCGKVIPPQRQTVHPLTPAPSIT